jgi:predicted 3-demethylubiquinone-9 3-methyltransferase (glyoxalase superfamily)
MSKHLYPCLWFDGRIAEATHYYCSLFEHSKIHAENNIITKFELEGTVLKLLNGGAIFSKNPSISLFVKCTTKSEVEKLYHALSTGGKAMIPLGSYPWCSYYAWVEDQFGMTWQLFMGTLEAGEQKIIPSLLFTKEVFGKGLEAMQFYTRIFKEGKVNSHSLYEQGEGQPIGSLKFGSFALHNAQFAAMDGPGEHAFTFNEGISLVVECVDQAEIDYYWENLTQGGQEGKCGWLQDKFGLSWQIIPIELNALMGNPATAEKARNAFLKMKKFIIKDLY